MGLESVRNANDRLGRAQHHEAVRLDHSCKTLEDPDLGVLVEIDQHVSAEDHVEASKMAEVLQQVELPMADHGANIGIELPHLADLGEILNEQLNRQAPLNLELAEESSPGLLQYPLRQIGCHDLNTPAGKCGAHFLQQHRNRIGLLAGR